MEIIIEDFKKYLLSQKISTISINNYLVDLRNFLEWFILSLKTNLVDFDESQSFSLLSNLNTSKLEEYKSFLLNNNSAPKTINRRLSTLRRFSLYCKDSAYTQFNSAQFIRNSGTKNNDIPLSTSIINEFSRDLSQNKISALTIKNYVVDIRQLLSFLSITVSLVILLPSQNIFNIYQYTSNILV